MYTGFLPLSSIDSEENLLQSSSGYPSYANDWLEKAKDGTPFTEEEMCKLCSRVQEIFSLEPSVQQVKLPVVICGDIHGQFHDLLKLIKENGDPADTFYLFLGDYLDRGYYSLETITLLFSYKVSYPDNIWLLRGNHETRSITKVYGFYDECMSVYGNGKVWNACMEACDYLGLAAVIGLEYFCVHGGLSPQLNTIDQISQQVRRKGLEVNSMVLEIMWSDPEDIEEEWQESPRGVGWLFGHKPVKSFCHINGSSAIIRAHQLVMEGYRYMFDEKILTVWSAPNYVSKCKNKAAVAYINTMREREMRVFTSAPTPPTSKKFKLLKSSNEGNNYFT